MMLDFNLERFIREKVTRRERSLLADDFERYDAELHARIDGKRGDPVKYLFEVSLRNRLKILPDRSPEENAIGGHRL